jgi:hypothetical protein
VDAYKLQVDKLKARIDQLEKTTVCSKNEKAVKLQEKLENGSIALLKVKRQRDKLKKELQEQKYAFNDLREEFQMFLTRIRVKECHNDTCPNFDLYTRRVLLVGGRSKLRSFYKKIVIDLGGEFDYHDGTYYKGEKTLQQKIHRSDIVLCPVDVNSHAACLGVKRYSKKLNKSYFMLPNSSISTLFNKLTELAL